MGEFLLSIVRDASVAVLAAVVLASIKWWFPALGQHMGSIEAADEPPKSLGQDVGAYLLRVMLLFGATLMMLMMVMDEVERPTLDLREARYIGWMLPSATFTWVNLGGSAFKMLMIVLVPAVIAESLIVWPLRIWARSAGYANPAFTTSLRLFAVMVVPLLVVVHGVYVFTSMSYAEAWLQTLAMLFVVFLGLYALAWLTGSMKKTE